jgi:hypothetical protein
MITIKMCDTNKNMIKMGMIIKRFIVVPKCMEHLEENYMEAPILINFQWKFHV